MINNNTCLARVVSVGVLCFIEAFSSTPAHAAQNDWPMARHDARNTAHTEERIDPSLHLQWRVPYCKHPSTTILASGNAICVSNTVLTGGESSVTTLFSISGKLLWALPDTVPVYLKGETLIVVTQKFRSTEPSIICYNWKRHSATWRCTLQGEVTSFDGAVVADNLLLCSYSYADLKIGRRACLNEIDLNTGVSLASRLSSVQEWSEGSPAINGDEIYYGVGHQLLILNRDKLAQELEYEDGGNAGIMYSYAGANLITKGWEHHLQSFDTVTMSRLWIQGASREIQHSLVMVPGRAPAVFESSSCIDVVTGKPRWQAPVYAVDSASTANLLFVAGGAGDGVVDAGFAGLDVRTGKILWRYQHKGLEGVGIIVSEGSVIATGSDGYLYRFSKPDRNRGATRQVGTKRKLRILPSIGSQSTN